MFNPERLALARRRRGMTKKALADAAEMSVKSISDYENDHAVPSEAAVAAIGQALRFPVEFFEGPDLESPTADNASFRAMSAMTASQREAALGAGTLAMVLCDWIQARFDLPKVDVPTYREIDPEAAAASVRSEWKIGVAPIRNMIHLLEVKGVRVFSLAEQCREVDAFSLWWRGQVPVVFLNTMKTAEHSRFDAAHELGHLVLHKRGTHGGREGELEADAFASAFLMPRESVLASAPKFASLDAIVRLKKTWSVSVAALNRRLHDVGAVSDWHYRSLCIQIAKLGYRKSEPQGIEPERSQVLEKVLQALREEEIGTAEIARELKLSRHDVDELLFGLATVRVEGGGQKTPRSRDHLRLV
ncbi:MAG TPA: ImmA/IrrE family metallo-endopeptidase [Polyangia bacterium]|nr:ImmA/IrrE family metallo-endopeptidase [Polyangia bacterium]